MADQVPPSVPAWYPPPPLVVPPRTSAATIVLVILLVLLIGACLFSGWLVTTAAAGAGRMGPLSALQVTVVGGDRSSRHVAAVIPIEGPIMGSTGRGLTAPAEDVVSATEQRLERAAEEGAKVLVLWIDSPGGGVGASAALHRAILDYKKKHATPVVALLRNVAASGGYYVAAAADVIVADAATLTGSIGVIVNHFDASTLLEQKLGVKTDAIVSAPQKDIMSMFRPMRAEERQHLQTIVDEMYARFVAVVVEGRRGKVTAEAVRALESTVLSGQQALAAQLVDRLGGLDEALAEAARLADVPSLRAIRHERPRSFFEELLGVTGPGVSPLERIAADHLALPPLLYLWRP